jgi:hypothetical protein
MSTLEKDLKHLKRYIANLKMRLAIDLSARNWKFVFDFMEIKNPEKISGEIKDINVEIDNFAKQIEQKLKLKYETKSEPTNRNQIPVESSPTTTERDSSNVGEDWSSSRRLRKDSLFKPKFKDQKAELTTQESFGCDQLTAAQEIFDNIYYNKFRGQQLIAPPGSGKTFILGSAIRNLIHVGLLADCMSPWPILWVTKSSVVSQNKEELEEYFNLDCINTVHIINIEQLRAALVGTLITEETVVKEGEPSIEFRWRKGYEPALTIYDESQALARSESLQSKVVNSRYKTEHLQLWETYEIDSSATPWSRICEAKHFALSTHKEFNNGVINLENWGEFSREVANKYRNPDDTITQPENYSPSAVRDFVNLFEDRIVWVKNVKPKHKGYLHLLPMELDSEDLKKEYRDAEENHYKRKAMIESSETMSDQQKQFSTLASYTIFAKAAENCRRYITAKWINDKVNNGLAPAVGFRFKQTGVSIIRILFEDYNWSRKDISIIWGGATESLSAKKKLALKLKNSKAQELMEELEIDIEKDLGIFLNEIHEKTEEQLAWEKEHNLLSQDAKQREAERKAFVSQKAKAAMFTYKSGGVGLSLHHQKEYPKALQRAGLFTPDYSEKLGIQAFGRLPRLTSISDTHMWLAYFLNTIEVDIVGKFISKCQSLREVTRSNECWTELEEDRAALSLVEII